MSVAAGWRPPRLRRLSCGLTVALVERRQAPVVSTVLCYRGGAAAEPPELAGLAHFLEHMMFKGSAAYAAGEVDRVTQVLGGSNNAFTGHDATLYQFSFGADRWHQGLAIEADRMTGLRLEEREVEAEREVILEELAGIEDDPWGALDLAVLAELYGDHPYGRPVLGGRESLERIGRPELAEFHRRHYRPDGAVLVVAGDVGEEAFGEIEQAFGAVGPRADAPDGLRDAVPGPPRRAAAGRVEMRRGELARLLVALPAPPAGDRAYAPLRLLLTVLVGGRCSRLHRLLVEDHRLCSSVGAEIDETVGPGAALLACELLPGAAVADVEERLFAELRGLAAQEAQAEELDRARRLLAADWVFARETVGQEAMATATAVCLFDPEHDRRHLERLETCSAAELEEAAGYLDGDGAVIGWSLPEGGD